MRRPARWLESGDAPLGARDLLAAAASPDAGARERVWSSLGATTGAKLPALSPLAKGAGAAGKTAVAAGATTKAMMLSASLVAALGAGGAAWRANRPHESPVATLRTTTTRGVGSPRHEARLQGHVAPPAPSPPPSAPAPLAEPAPPRLTVRLVRPPIVRARTIAAAEPPRHAATDSPLDRSAPNDPPTLREEVALLGALRAAATGDPARALALAAAHAARFGDDATLAHEREGFAVTALHSLGRDVEAAARADAFLRAHPTSTVAPRIRALRAAMETHP